MSQKLKNFDYCLKTGLFFFKLVWAFKSHPETSEAINIKGTTSGELLVGINKKFLTCQLLTEIFCQALTEFEIFCQDLTEFEIFCQGLTDIFCQGLTEFFGLFMWSADRFFSVKYWQIFFFKQQSLLTNFWASWQILSSSGSGSGSKSKSKVKSQT